MIKYLGSKRLLIPHILQAIQEVCPTGYVLDLFSGTSRVGHALKQAGYRVRANDLNAYACVLARCYVQADADDEALMKDIGRLIPELSALPGKAGYFTNTFCEQARFFHPKNGERVDAIRERIRELSVEPEREAILLTSLMEAADRVDSTTGVQMAYLKNWAPRAHNPLSLRVPNLLPRAMSGKGDALQGDALEVALLYSDRYDVAYLDPPYNQHSYLGNYHVWESLVLWDKPPVYGVAKKREDCRTRKSPFNSKRKVAEAFRELVSLLQANFLVVSYSNEGYLSYPEIHAILSSRGSVRVVELDYKRYVGAQIGIHNLKGEVVGEVSHLRNTEFLFVVEVRP